MIGPRPKPTHLAVVDKGHASRHRGQAVPSSALPVAPERLSPEAKFYFDELVKTIQELYPCSASHTEMLALFAEAKERALHLEHLLKTEGLTQEIVTANSSSIKARPEVAMYEKARAEMKGILIEFGLSPSASRNVKIAPAKTKANSFADLDD